MADQTKTEDKPATETKPCPHCGAPMRPMLFMGVQPDGYVCDVCSVWCTDDGQPLAIVF